jgi:hypothetical protein
MSEPMSKREDGTQPVPSWATYVEATNEFTKSAKAFMEHVHLLTAARTAYQEAMSLGTELRNRLEAGDRTLRGLMTQLGSRSGSGPVYEGEPRKVLLPFAARCSDISVY